VKTLSIALGLALAYLRQRTLSTALNVALLALGAGTIIALLVILQEAEQRMDRDTASVDLVIGAKGSPLQLVLSSLFQVDAPTGNVTLGDAATIIAEPQVKRAVPLALGDSFRSYRIVGTNPAYAELYGATLADGAFWTKPQQAVIGAEVARATGLKLGSTFVGSHGLGEGGGGHDAHPFSVVGVLNATGSVIDRVILTSVESVWLVHDHPAEEKKPGDANAKNGDHKHDHDHDHEHLAAKEVTAYLIQYSTPLAAASFPRMVNQSSALQAASPAVETARLFSLIGIGVTALKAFAVVMMVCAGLSIFIGLMNALNERRADLALLRLLGAAPATVFLTIASQGAVLGALGVILGVVFGHVGADVMSALIEKQHGIRLAGWRFVREEWWVVAGTLLLAVAASIWPAWRAYRESVPETLSRQ
jgi:putative ABC transport system permease protein